MPRSRAKSPVRACLSTSGPRRRTRILKRALDLSVAALCLVVAAIVLILVALAIWLTDGGPVIYRHRRVGRGGAAFDCLKFRTMARDADRALAAHLARSPAARAEWAATRKLRADPRILGRLGRFLRRTSLDELPQLFNVLRGEMSLVGPRPIVREELVHYGGQSRWYLAVRPGVTGPWQVGGRSDTSYATRVRLDVQYARNPSLRPRRAHPAADRAGLPELQGRLLAPTRGALSAARSGNTPRNARIVPPAQRPRRPRTHAPGRRSNVGGAAPGDPSLMAYTSKIQALDAICRSHGGGGGHGRAIRALNEWCVLLGGTGGHVRNVRALNEICAPPRRRGRPLPGDPRAQRHRRPPRRHGRPPPQPRRPDRDRRPHRQPAGPPGRCGSSAPATAASPTAGREPRPTTAATCCTATPRSTSPSGGCAARWCTTRAPTSSPPPAAPSSNGSTPTSPALLAAMAEAGNPVVLIHLGTHSLPWVALADMQAQASADHRRPDRRRRAHPLAPGEPPLRRQRARAGERGEAPRLQRLAAGAGRAPTAAGSGRSTTCRPSPPTALATGDAARAGLQRDDLHDAQAGAFVKAAAALAVIEALPPVAGGGGIPRRRRGLGRRDQSRPATASTPPTGPARSAAPTTRGPGSSLACAFSTETAGGRTWSVMQLGGTGGDGEHARLYQAPYATGYAGGDTVRFRVRVAWENLVDVRAVKVVVFHYGTRLLRHQHRQRRRRPRPGRRARGGPGGQHGAEREPQPSSR